MFYAVQAVLTLKDVSFSRHGQVKACLNKEFSDTWDGDNHYASNINVIGSHSSGFVSKVSFKYNLTG